jgi:hypothetical protein
MRSDVLVRQTIAGLALAYAIAIPPLFGDPITATGPGGLAPQGDGPGPGQVLIYSNFGPGGSFQTPGGTLIGSVLTPTGTINEVLAESFTSPATLLFADAQLALFTAAAVGNVGGTSAMVYLESNGAGVPGTILDTLIEQSPIGNSPAVITFDCQLCPLLSAGGTYWIVAAQGNGATAWNAPNSNIGGSESAYNQNGSAVGPWIKPIGQIGAFEVDGAPVPEPGSIALLGTVLIGLAWAVRRKAARPHR